MTLRDYIETHPETMQDMELASTDRLWEGIELLVAGRQSAGAYLLGYVVEMVLKNACFLFDGARPADEIRPRLGPCRSLGKQCFPAIGCENYHSLVFWYHVLLRKRYIAGRPLPSRMARELGRRIARIHSMWTVDMRYYPDRQIHPDTPGHIYDDVFWIYDRRGQLGR